MSTRVSTRNAFGTFDKIKEWQKTQLSLAGIGGGGSLTNTNIMDEENLLTPFAQTAKGMAKMGGAQVIGGVVKTVGSLIGGGKRRREQRAAERELASRKMDFENLDISNPYKNITNPYQNLTVSTQAADFAAQQTAQGAANIMNNLAAAAGGGGVAALAQSLANSQAMAAQQASADLAKQEQRNAMLGAQGESSRQMAVAAGEEKKQRMH
jgi:hypothetical protein